MTAGQVAAGTPKTSATYCRSWPSWLRSRWGSPVARARMKAPSNTVIAAFLEEAVVAVG